MSSRYGVLIFALMLSACGPTRVEYKEVAVYKYITVPAKYTAHVDITEPVNDTVGEMRNVAYKRKLGLQFCNKKLDSILFIQGTTPDGN
jgi:hypothetical protein